MAIISTITSSLPNILNLLQGSWSVSYKARKALSLDEKIKSGEEVVSSDWTSTAGLLAFADFASSAFDDGWNVIDFDSFIDMQEVIDTSITQNPVEGGSFRSVNKVRKPRIIKVTLAKGGIGYGIEDTLKSVRDLVPKARYGAKTVKKDLMTTMYNTVFSILSGDTKGTAENVGKLMDATKENGIPMEFRILTPFDMITNLNLVKMDYTFKKDNGRNMLIMYLTFQEMLEVDSNTVSTNQKIKTPTSAINENIGRISAMKG